MYSSSLLPATEGYLSRIALPKVSFKTSGELPPALEPIWELLQQRDYRRAYTLIEATRNREAESDDVQAALLAAEAAIDVRMGRTRAAEQLAEASIRLWTKQTLAWFILFEVRLAEQDYAGAYEIIARLDGPEHPLSWDEPVASRTRHIAAASLAWRRHDWEAVAEHVALAYPQGLAAMPEWVLEDYFRLSFYRDLREEAAAAAALLIRKRTVESADVLLQTLVQQGWTEQALPLYRTAYSEAPRSALLRRRLVALCLREGAVEEARNLARPAALEIARAAGQVAK